MLACPLPIDTLASVSEIIGIDSQTMDATSSFKQEESGSEVEREVDSAEVLQIERSTAILNLRGACQAELLRSENASQPLAAYARSKRLEGKRLAESFRMEEEKPPVPPW